MDPFSDLDSADIEYLKSTTDYRPRPSPDDEVTARYKYTTCKACKGLSRKQAKCKTCLGLGQTLKRLT